MTASRRATYLAAALSVALAAVAADRTAASLFTPGDLVVTTYGSAGADTSQGAPTPISLKEFSTAGGAPILTDTLPITDGAGGSANVGVVGQYGSSSEGDIQLSGDGLSLTLAGYSATAAAAGIQSSTNTANGTNFASGTPFNNTTVSLAQSADTDVPRVAISVDANGKVNSSTVLNDVYNTNNPRAVYSPGGSTFFISGQGDGNKADQGIFSGPVGLNTVKSPGIAPGGIYNSHDTRFVTVYNGNMYFCMDTSSGTPTGIWKFNGIPSGSVTPTQVIPGNNGLTGSSRVYYSPSGFFFANASTLYVADTGVPKAGSLGDGGIQKWSLIGSTWTLQYTLVPSTTGWIAPGNPLGASSGETGFEAITGQVIGTGANAKVELCAVSYTLTNANPDGLYSITDTLDATTASGEAFTELESAAGDGGLLFKGVSFAPVPEPSSLGLFCLGSIVLLSRRRRHDRYPR